MLNRLILKVTKFQLPPPNRLDTVVTENIFFGGGIMAPPCQIGLTSSSICIFKAFVTRNLSPRLQIIIASLSFVFAEESVLAFFLVSHRFHHLVWIFYSKSVFTYHEVYFFDFLPLMIPPNFVSITQTW